MALQVKNTKQLTEDFKWKVLVYSPAGFGKTAFLATANALGRGVGVAACEQGHGKGLLTVAHFGLDYVTPTTFQDYMEFVDGKCFADKDTVALDNISSCVKTFVKDYALTMPRKFGETIKRKAGVPEQDDYGTIGALTYRMLDKLLSLPKNILVVAHERLIEADPENGRKETVIGPDLPGMMFEAAPGMFDVTLRLRRRMLLRDPKDPKSKYLEYYFQVVSDATARTKSRLTSSSGQPLLAAEEPFDLAAVFKGDLKAQGSFPYLYEKIVKGYATNAAASSV
jgi:hypothetical protein